MFDIIIIIFYGIHINCRNVQKNIKGKRILAVSTTFGHHLHQYIIDKGIPSMKPNLKQIPVEYYSRYGSMLDSVQIK